MKLIKLLFVVIILLIVTNVTLTNRAVDESGVVSALQTDIENLARENSLLKVQIAEAGSLSVLQPKIAEAGFLETPTVVALPTPPAVALR